MTDLLLFIYAFFAMVLEKMTIFTFDLASVGLIKYGTVLTIQDAAIVATE